MNTVLIPKKFQEKISSGLAYPAILGNENGSAIADASTGLAFEITNNIGDDILVTSLSLGFDVAYTKALIEIKNTQQNRFIVSGSVQLGAIGTPNTTKSTCNSELEIVPFILKSGQYVQVFISNSLGVSIPAKSISLSLNGLQ